MLVEDALWVNADHTHQLVLPVAVLLLHGANGTLHDVVGTVDVDVAQVVLVVDYGLEDILLVLMGAKRQQIYVLLGILVLRG
jgi:hypothetical protein